MLFGKHHRRIETDNRKIARNVQDFLYDFFARGGIQKIYLSRIVPRHSGAVIPVINIAHILRLHIDPFKDDGAVSF